MRIYRAVFEYNNGDSNEWEKWFSETSPWYMEKSLALQHIPQLEKFRDYLRTYYVGCNHFSSKKPYIEEQDIEDTFKPMSITFDGIKFKEFNYVPYKGPHNIGSQTLNLTGFPKPDWNIVVSIGEEMFDIKFSNWDIPKGNYYIDKSSQEDSLFYKYHPAVREEMFNTCREYAETILPYYKKYVEDSKALNNWDDYEIDDPRRTEGWENQRISEIANIEKLLRNTHISLTEFSIDNIKFQINHEIDIYPKYAEALIKLLKY